MGFGIRGKQCLVHHFTLSLLFIFRGLVRDYKGRLVHSLCSSNGDSPTNLCFFTAKPHQFF